VLRAEAPDVSASLHLRPRNTKSKEEGVMPELSSVQKYEAGAFDDEAAAVD
jgi:hypothetical protein